MQREFTGKVDAFDFGAPLTDRTGAFSYDDVSGPQAKNTRRKPRGYRNGLPPLKPYVHSPKQLCPVCGTISADPGMVPAHRKAHGQEAWRVAVTTT